MISIYPKKIFSSFSFLFSIFALGFFLVPYMLFAQGIGGLSLSVTPTLFQMSAIPSQSWNSGVKVINNNPHELTVYAQVVNFAPQGESGEGKFIPVFTSATEGTTLAEWIAISKEPFTIEAEKSFTIPFTVSVPEKAAPGGHFAAILVGTKPPEGEGAIKVSTSQVVTSLFFVRIAGDVNEEGVIREFRSGKSFVNSPEANFEVRFENKGNVHLQPQGEIVITNMWGKERGIVPINHQTHFGNVLPNSIRKFEFTWRGESSFADIGRYKAVITLAYGEENRKFETSIDHFYVIPLKATLIVLGVLCALFVLVRWSINAYIRKMLLLSGIDPYEQALQKGRRVFEQEGDVRIMKRASVRAPLAFGFEDLKNRLSGAEAYLQKARAFILFVRTYKKFFASFGGIVVLSAVLVYFLKDAMTEQRDYEVVIDNPDSELTLSSEDIHYQESQEEHVVVPKAKEQNFAIILVNSSDTPGAAAYFQSELEREGYNVGDLQSDFNASKARTVIVFDQALQEEALTFSKIFGGALLSADTGTSSKANTLTVYIGNDIARTRN